QPIAAASFSYRM
ncbi:hypothetical protein VCHC71A1_03155B, partial [Vibrio cholerae HC-71A1]